MADVVGRAVAWDRRKSVPSKGDYWACCPFHGEKTPSFHADNRKGRYHCFGCGASGDIFTFLTEKEGLSFPEAVEQLARQAGVELPRAEPGAREREKARESLHDVMEKAASFFETQLQAREGAHARGYLSDRGLSPATISHFRIGFAPAGRYGLKEHLGKAGVSVEQMVAAGLLVSGEDIAVPFDRFRERIMFPILDLRGRVVAFGGRALSPQARAKYLNSPETALFHKRAMLYNAHGARAAAHEKGGVIAVEGYMDVIALAQAGIVNAVAPLGTALTVEQIQLLWRLADEPVLCFDGDAAGLKAAYRAVDEALALLTPGKSLSFALLPEGMDPDDLVRAQGPAALETVIAQALALVDMIWQREVEGQDLSTPERRAALEKRLRQIVHQIGDEAVRRHYSAAIKERLDALWRPAQPVQGRRGRGAPPGGGKGPRRPAGAARGPVSQAFRGSALVRGGAAPLIPREAVLVACVLNHPLLLEEEAETFGSLSLADGGLDRLRRAILDIAAHEETGGGAETLAAQLEAQGFGELMGRIDAIVRRGRDSFALATNELRHILPRWRHIVALHRKSSTLNKELAEAERALAEDGSEASLARLKDIQAQLESLEGREALIDELGK